MSFIILQTFIYYSPWHCEMLKANVFSLLLMRGWGSEIKWLRRDNLAQLAHRPRGLCLKSRCYFFYATKDSCLRWTSLMLNVLIVGGQGRDISKVNPGSASYLWILQFEHELWKQTGQWFPLCSLSVGELARREESGPHARSSTSETLRVGPIKLGSPPGEFEALWRIGSPAWPIQTRTYLLTGLWNHFSNASPKFGLCLHWPDSIFWKGYWREKQEVVSLRLTSCL